MSQRITATLLSLILAPLVMAGPSPIYQNPGIVTTPPTIDATIFQNSGDFNISTLVSFSNLLSTADVLATPIPFATRDTLYFTNSGSMSAIPGFRFDTSTAKKRFSARNVVNSGTIVGQDVPGIPSLYSAPGGTTIEAIPQYSQPIPSEVYLFATNVINSGEIGVGNFGLLQIVSKNFTNAFGSLAAGGVNTGSTGALTLSDFGLETLGDPLDETGRGVADTLNGFYTAPPYTYDLFWGTTNGGNLRVDNLANELPGTPPIDLHFRGEGNIKGNFLSQGVGNGFSGYACYIDTFSSPPGQNTNIYWEIVLVDTNFADTNINVNVEFSPLEFNSPPLPLQGDPNFLTALVQYSVTTTDVLSGNEVTNAIYLVDSGGNMTNMVLLTNAAEASVLARPLCLEVTTSTPEEWLDGTPAPITTFDPTVIYQQGSFQNNSVPFIAAEYSAQIGRDPETLSGQFTTSFSTNLSSTNLAGLETSLLFGAGVTLPDPTNEGARIEITAGQADLTAARIRAEGIVELNITNLIGAGTGASDYGMADAKIGMTNGSLVLASLFPTSFQRVRGTLSAWSGSWQNVFTNALTTNQYHYHVLVVDQNLRGNFKPSIRHLTLTGKQEVNVQNDLTVIGQSMFDTPNLVINANITLTQGAGNVYPANMPQLKNLVVNPGGSLVVDSLLDVGYDLNALPGNPNTRKYTVSEIANFGTIEATAPLFQSQLFVNDGEIVAVNNGSMAVNASQISLGSLTPDSVSFLAAEGNISLSSQSLGATNSELFAGLTQAGSLTLDVTKSISDGVSGAPSVTPNIVNEWQVTDGFRMTVKPAAGDLFGTQITTIASTNTLADHIWAGIDMGPTSAGFNNNVVIGRLVLDRTAQSGVLRFTGAGTQNAMYVDFLDLTNFSYSDYRNNLIIDPNIKIYFANANVDPFKLTEVYPNQLIWVTNFTGPNSTVAVSNLVNSSVCLMNAALYSNQVIGFFGIPNALNQPFVLNNPSNPEDTFPCPGEDAVMDIVAPSPASVSSSRTQTQSLTVTSKGSGSVGPTLTIDQLVVGNNETLTATPAKGWTFANWTVSGLKAGVETNLPVLKFAVTRNATITANFIPIPFPALKGVYNGLFYDPKAVSGSSAGYFTLTMGSSGAFSGRLMMGPNSYSFSSLFFGSGYQQVQVKAGNQNLTMNLVLDTSGKTGAITGDIAGANWDAPLLANLTPVWTAKNPSPAARRYTMALTGAAGLGDSFGVVNVSPLGVVSVTGSLADGVTYNQSAPVSKSGQWPFYAYAASGKDTVLGWINFAGGSLSAANVAWIKAPNASHYYPGGFNDILQLIGSPYVAPTKNSPVLSLLNASVTLSGGNLANDINSPVSLQKNLGYGAGSTIINFTAATGAFSGKFGAKQTMSGVVLQNQDNARGFFLGTTESGAVLLQGN
jgi:hypothetical protein